MESSDIQACCVSLAAAYCNIMTNRQYLRAEPMLRDDVLDHVPMYVSQTVIAALIAEAEFFVIEAQQLHNSSLQVVDMNFVFHDAKSEFIGLAVVVAALDSAAGHPHCETVRIVVPTQDLTL